MGRDVGTIGKSVIIKGELSAEEDLTIEGQVEGRIELDHSELTIGPNGRVTGDVLARAVIVMGTVSGNITATEKINLRETASVDGDLVTPSLGIAEGASGHELSQGLHLRPPEGRRVSGHAGGLLRPV